MGDPRPRAADSPITKDNPVARAVVVRWRALTGGGAVRDHERRTIVACSGGVDSCAVALALHAYGGLAGLVHVVHDFRPRAEAEADRDVAKGLAERLGVRFEAAEVRVAGLPGNAEANARHARYAAIAELAVKLGATSVATAHHADDQLETMLVRLARGAGPRGLSGIRAKRRLAAGVDLIRPALRVTRAELRSLCDAAGVVPAIDATNNDGTRDRAFLRASVTPQLLRIAPDAPRHAALAAERLARVAVMLRTQAKVLLARAESASGGGGGGSLDRAVLAAQPHAVVAEALLLAWARAGRGDGGRRLRASVVDGIVAAIMDGVGGEREFRLGGTVVRVSRDRVGISGA